MGHWREKESSGFEPWLVVTLALGILFSFFKEPYSNYNNHSLSIHGYRVNGCLSLETCNCNVILS